MKIFNIIEEGRFGGPQKRIADISLALKKFDVETIVALPDRNSDNFIQFLSDKSIQYHTFKHHRLGRKLSEVILFVLTFPKEVNQLRHLIKVQRPDIVHCNGSWQWKGALAAKLSGVPVVWHLNDTSMPSFIRKIFNLVSRFCASGFFGASNKSIEYYQNHAMGKLKDLTFLIPSTVDIQFFSPSKASSIDLPNEEQSINIVTVGNVNPDKDHATLLQAAKHLQENFDLNVHFHIIGAIFDTQKKLIEQLNLYKTTHKLNNVHFHGAKSNIRDWLAKADIYICCSENEASPISVWEAASMRCNIISTNVGDIQFLNERYDFSTVVEVRDAEAMAQSIALIASDFESFQFKRNNARKMVEDFCSIEVIAKKHLQGYKKILSATMHDA